jgi:hypothetical protein
MYKIKVSKGTTNTWNHLAKNPIMNMPQLKQNAKLIK